MFLLKRLFAARQTRVAIIIKITVLKQYVPLATLSAQAPVKKPARADFLTSPKTEKAVSRGNRIKGVAPFIARFKPSVELSIITVKNSKKVNKAISG